MTLINLATMKKHRHNKAYHSVNHHKSGGRQQGSKINDEMQKAEKKATAKNIIQKNNTSHTISNMWFWLGISILILILLYWVFFIAIDFGPNQ